MQELSRDGFVVLIYNTNSVSHPHGGSTSVPLPGGLDSSIAVEEEGQGELEWRTVACEPRNVV